MTDAFYLSTCRHVHMAGVGVHQQRCHDMGVGRASQTERKVPVGTFYMGKYDYQYVICNLHVLCPKISVVKTDVSTTEIHLDTSVLMTLIVTRREYMVKFSAIDRLHLFLGVFFLHNCKFNFSCLDPMTY